MERNLLRARNRSANIADVQRVALDLMRRVGYDATTIAEVAHDAGVSPSTVYRYFGTKEALVLTGDGTDGLLAEVAAVAGDDRSVTPLELFGGAAARMLRDADRDSLLDRLRLVFADETLTAAFEHDLLGRRHELAERLATHRGAKTPAVRDEAIAGALLGVLLSVLDRWQRSNGEKSLVKMLDKALSVL